MIPNTPQQHERAPLILLCVLVAIMSSGVMFNVGVSSMSPILIDEFGISDGQFGLIMTLVYLTAGVTAGGFGGIADRIGARTQIGIIAVGGAAALALTIVWHTYPAFLIAAAIAGVSQAFSHPVTNRIIARRVAPVQRSEWIGWKQSGVPIGMLVAGLMFPLIATVGGWSAAAWTGTLVCAIIVVVSWVVIGRIRGARPALHTPPAAAAVSAKRPLPRTIWALTGISFLNALGVQGVNTYVSLFSVRYLAVPLSIAGLAVSAIGVFGILSRVGWGKIGRSWRPAPLIAVMSVGGMLGIAALAISGATGQSWLLWIGVAMHASFPLAANVVVGAAIISATPHDRIGIATGLTAGAMYFGYATGPALIGVILDASNDFIAAWLTIGVAYALCLVIALKLPALERRDSAGLR